MRHNKSPIKEMEQTWQLTNFFTHVGIWKVLHIINTISISSHACTKSHELVHTIEEFQVILKIFAGFLFHYQLPSNVSESEE